MRLYDELLAASRPVVPFSNGTSWEIWSYEWCRLCATDENQDCPLILLAMSTGRTPEEWISVGLQNYTCTEFDALPEGQVNGHF